MSIQNVWSSAIKLSQESIRYISEVDLREVCGDACAETLEEYSNSVSVVVSILATATLALIAKGTYRLGSSLIGRCCQRGEVGAERVSDSGSEASEERKIQSCWSRIASRIFFCRRLVSKQAQGEEKGLVIGRRAWVMVKGIGTPVFHEARDPRTRCSRLFDRIFCCFRKVSEEAPDGAESSNPAPRRRHFAAHDYGEAGGVRSTCSRIARRFFFCCRRQVREKARGGEDSSAPNSVREENGVQGGSSSGGDSGDDAFSPRRLRSGTYANPEGVAGLDRRLSLAGSAADAARRAVGRARGGK
ncbi:MAG: hypothetical protein KR126chlam1_01398 [Chlamydiae bacterium]|nr:hypothetical protein [Chlamydiota bacterium]